MSAILADGVSKTYRGGAEALRSVSLAIEPGEIFGLLGPNGAGKTTLVKILLDIVRPTKGRTELLGVTSRSAKARRPVGYLPEDHRLPDYHTPRSALAFYGGLSGVSGARLRSRTNELLGQVGLADVSGKKIRGFSKGMRQRLGLAQALVSDPQLMFLDEPTDGIDPVGRAEIRGILAEQKKRGRTVFLNSHLLSEVEQLCDRVAILNKGEVVRCGTIEELTRTELVFTITTTAPIAADVLAELRNLVASAQPLPAGAHGVDVGIAREEAIDGVVDLLRARGVAIRGLVSKRHSLEQVFLASLQPGKTP